MPVYVDRMQSNGWRLRGHAVRNCHLFTDDMDLTELHEIAERIGMKRAWFQNSARAPHYDLTQRRREAAIAAGAIPVDRHAAVAIWRARRVAVQVKEGRAGIEFASYGRVKPRP